MKALFSHILKDIIAPSLKKLGFKKSGNTFLKPEEGFTKVFVVQSSQWSSPDSLRFTIEVGIHFHNFHSQVFGKVPSTPLIQDCLWQYRRRIGALKDESDTWYEITQDTDIDSLTQEIVWDIGWHVRRYFEQYQNLHNFYTR